MVVIGESSVVDPKGACWVVGAGTGVGFISCVVPQITALIWFCLERAVNGRFVGL